MRDPVTLETGHTYERTAIEKWFNECKEKGRPLVCPTSGKELESAVLKPSIALRQTIEEWRMRNEAARIENAGLLLMSKSSQQDVLHGLKDIQVVIQKNRSSKHSVRNSGLIPLIAGCLRQGERVRFLALATLRTLAEDDDESKVSAMLSPFPCFVFRLPWFRSCVISFFSVSQHLYSDCHGYIVSVTPKQFIPCSRRKEHVS
jgi:hypothetical protein